MVLSAIWTTNLYATLFTAKLADMMTLNEYNIKHTISSYFMTADNRKKPIIVNNTTWTPLA